LSLEKKKINQKKQQQNTLHKNSAQLFLGFNVTSTHSSIPRGLLALEVFLMLRNVKLVLLVIS